MRNIALRMFYVICSKMTNTVQRLFHICYPVSITTTAHQRYYHILTPFLSKTDLLRDRGKAERACEVTLGSSGFNYKLQAGTLSIAEDSSFIRIRLVSSFRYPALWVCWLQVMHHPASPFLISCVVYN